MLTTIEDLILHIYDRMNGYDRKALPARDRSILFSMGAQLKKPLALTERQASLAIKILTENKHLYDKIENLNQLLDSPLYKYPFRSIDSARRIFVLDKIQVQHSVLNIPSIAVKFPFDHALNKLLDKIPSRKQYSVDHRAHCYKLSEENIRSIMDLFHNKEFIVDPQIQEWYDEINKIAQNPVEYVPSAIVENGLVKLVNCNKPAEEYFDSHKTSNLVEDLFLAKSMNLFISRTLIENLVDIPASEMAKKLLSNSSHSVSVAGYAKDSITKMIQDLNAWPVLMLIDEKENELKDWVLAFNNAGVANANMSVLFRSDKNTEFNEYIKNEQLNNLVDDNTKIVFVKQKMPKVLYKIDFTPKIVISSSTFYAHYTSQKVVDSHPTVLYYTEKQTIGKKIAKL